MFNSPYYNNYMQVSPGQRFNQYPQQPYAPQQQYTPQPTYTQSGLQGKTVDSIDVVRAMDIPLDREYEFFPIGRSEVLL